MDWVARIIWLASSNFYKNNSLNLEILIIRVILKGTYGDFPGGAVIKTSPSNAGGAALIPG